MLNKLNLEALNNAQRTAVMHGEGPLLVLAGPGSGKTFTITQRILYLIEAGHVPPEEILVITFTREAALSMERRFQEQSNQIYPVNFGTFHSVFYQILRNSHKSRVRQILRENQKKDLMTSILKQCNKTASKQIYHSLQEDAAEFLTAISFYKNTGNSEQALLKLPENKRRQFSEVFQAYEQLRKQQGAIDFDDMVYECVQLLEGNSSVREEWSKRFSHIIMDEFQDISPMQYRVIQQLAVSPYNLFAVGDDDQAIYGFRGASPDCMKKFLQDYGAQRVLLNVNYRSHPIIVKASMQIIEENKGRFPKELQPCREKMEEEQHKTGALAGLQVINFVGQEEQYTYLTERLRYKEEADTCAVLFRTNMYMQSLAARLNRLGIPYEMKEKTVSIYEHFIVKDIMTYLRLGTGERKRELYLQILNKPFRRISREALDTKTDREFILLEKQLDYLKTTSLYLGIQYICKVMGYERYLEDACRKQTEAVRRLEEWKQILDWLKEEAKHYESLAEWEMAQKAYAESLSKETEKPCECKKSVEEANEKIVNRVQLMTVHASKGLEFDLVYIPDCNERIYPHGSMPDKEQCEEERRIFYVAMTRAKKSLELLYLTGTKERPRLPSRFLNPLLKK